MSFLQDTIAAIATPPGEGGIAVIRVSGPEAIANVQAIFVSLRKANSTLSSATTHSVHYGHIVQNYRTIDEVLVSVLKAPRTFTAEDTIEISCHGGALITRLVLEAVLTTGVRLAEPGEFTRRAFLNGRIDLTQAEAVADLIHARTELAAQAAQRQLAGSLSREIHRLRDDLMIVLAHVEAHIDFPDEDISPDTQIQLLLRIRRGRELAERLLRTAREGEILRNGIRAAILGRPNAGKSSLLNELIGRDRAIVSPIAGTTRDTIEATANVRGFPVIFIDTAGLRTSDDLVEREGIRRSESAAREAELVLWVLDASQEFSDEDEKRLRTLTSKPTILVLNKSDLNRRCVFPQGMLAIEVSCATGQGMDALKDAIRDQVGSGRLTGELMDVTINARHQNALRRGDEFLSLAEGGLETGLSIELIAIELKSAVGAIGEIVGKTSTEDLLDVIFSQFCLGK